MGSASAVPKGHWHPPQLHSSIPWFSPATRTRSWFLSVSVSPLLCAESRRWRYSPVSCSGGPERRDDLSNAGDSSSVSGWFNRLNILMRKRRRMWQWRALPHL